MQNELELPTACGLSNISFGLPERTYVNTAFLTMAIANGLTMAIANPSQELLMNAAFASDMLLNKKESDIRYIERMNFLSENMPVWNVSWFRKHLQVHLRLAAKPGKRVREAAYFKQF